MKTFRLLTVLIAVLAIASCTDTRRADAILSRADSLMETAADSARLLLVKDSAMICSSGRAARMWYTLSRTEADDKCYITHTSDSTISAAAEYYSDNGTPLQRIRAHYLLGRVNYDLRLYGRALSAFKEVLSVKSDEDSVINRYKARAATWAGDLYEEKGLHNEALMYNRKSYEYATKSDVPVIASYSLRDIGRSYRNLNKNNIAIRYYIRAAFKAGSLNHEDLYSMVMAELASIYIKEGLTDKAREALFVPFKAINNIDLATYYFICAKYFERIGQLDSAIAYNKRGMSYGYIEKNKDVSRNVAKLYLKIGDKANALKNYNLYSYYADSLDKSRVIESEDYMSSVERMLAVERNNVRLAGSRLSLIISLSVLLFSIIAASLIFSKIYSRRKKKNMEQQERIRRYRRQKSLHEQQLSRQDKERIRSLEKELSNSSKTLTELRRKLLINETYILKNKEERIDFECKHRKLLEADFAETDVYRLYHNPVTSPSTADFHRLEDALNKTYNNFTLRLKEFYPEITDLELWICCMMKTGLTAKEICNISVYTPSSLSMAKSRLYKKMFHKKGSPKELDMFIRDF